MKDVVDISVGYESQIRETVKHDRRIRRQSTEGRPALGRTSPSLFAELAVILDEALPAASHSLTGATSALATVCRWSTETEEYVETDKQITVWNHGESTAHEQNTFGVARVIDGHYWFFGDCGAMADRSPEE